MGSFQSGFKMGADAFDSAERNRLLQEQLALDKARDARAAEEHGLRMSGLQRVENATQDLDRVTRLGIQNQDAIKANDADFEMAVEATGRGLAMPKAAPMLPEWNPASDIDVNKAQMALAAAKGDMQGMETLRASRKGMQWDEGYKKHFDDWSKMDDAAKGSLIDKLSLDANIKGYGSWVPGKGKQAGYMNYMAPGGDPVKLSAKEAGDLYVLTNLMQLDPSRARSEMDKVSDKVRAVASQAFEAQTKGVTANNTATHYANSDANDAARTSAIANRYNRPQASDLREFTDADGKAVMVDVTGLKRNADGTIPLPAGLKPRAAKPEYTPQAWASTVKDLAATGMSVEDAQMRADMMFGRGGPSGLDAKLQSMNKGLAGNKAPQIIRKGETSFVDPTRPVQSPIEDFMRESERGLFGGVNYFYRDPLTNRKYSVDEYNKLLSK
jgi:hypothetical protein